MQIALVLVLLAAALAVFAMEVVSVDVAAICVLLLLLAAGVISPEEAFDSFGSEMMVLLASIFVIAGALLKTGVLDTLAAALYRHTGGNYTLLLTSIVLVVCSLSAFMNNTVVTAVFVPVVMAVARRAKLAPSKLLMPVAFAAMLGGCCTLIGTSTNVAVSSLLTRRGMQPFSLFEFLPVGVALVVAGVLFFTLLGGKLLPARGAEELTKDYHVKAYLTEVILRPECPFIDKRIDNAGFQDMPEMNVLGIVRDKQTLLAPEGHEVFRTDDILILKAELEAIQRLRQTAGVEFKGDVILGDLSLESESIKLFEVMIGPGSRFLGRSLKDIDFRRRFQMTVLALHRLGEDIVEKIGKIPLMVGDLLLVQGPQTHLNELRATGNVLVLGDLSHILLERRKGFYVVSLFCAALALGGMGLIPLAPAVLAAAVMTVLVRAMPGEEVYRQIDWRLLILIGAMTGFGQAMVNTGADKFLANVIVTATGSLGVRGVLAGFFVLTVALSQPLSNAAAALTIVPIALATAERLGVNPRTFAVVVTLAASASFITPLEPSSVLVYPAGRYRFSDFIKVGGLLTLIVMAILLLMVPMIWKP
jgi:di/tricarboxylate transporter